MNLREELIDFVLESAASAPVGKRVRIYRGLADVCGTEAEHRQLNRMADDLEAVELRTREFHFQFQQNISTAHK